MSNVKCPMKFALRDDDPGACIEGECGWWHKYKKQCSVLVIANTFTLYQKYGVGSAPTGGGGSKGGRQGEF
jgi:hypothetical protein